MIGGTPPGGSRRGDLIAILLLAAVAMAIATYGMRQLGPGILDTRAEDTWFQSDVSRVVVEMTNRYADHRRSNVHPLFSLLTYPPALALRRLTQVTDARATGMIAVAIAGLWAAALYLLLRQLACRRVDAVVFSLLGLSSAAAIFWLPVRETYSLGSLSILVGLFAMAWANRRRGVQTVPWLVAGVATLAVTVTNWMVALIGTWLLLPRRRAMVMTVGSLVIALGCYAVEKRLMPATRSPMHVKGETEFMHRPNPQRVADVGAAFAVHTMVAPRVARLGTAAAPGGVDERFVPLPQNQVSVQGIRIGSAGAAASIATVAWVVVLGLGLIAAIRRVRRERIWLVVLLALAGQLALHIVYGEETFLYALHWAPLLVAVAAAATLTPARPLALGLAGVTLIAGGATNITQFRRAAQLYGPERQQMLREMRERPRDPWPRGQAHVVLGAPGSAETDKAYLEPGGSFSPRLGSFGVAIWVRDSVGKLLTTSDQLALSEIRSHFDSSADRPPPAVTTETPYYRAQWSLEAPFTWHLALTPLRPQSARLEVVVRSVGPAGGPVRVIAWNGTKLRVNDAWSITASPGVALAALGSEQKPAWTTAQNAATAWTGEGGWGYARLAVPADAPVQVTLVPDSAPAAPRLPPLEPLPSVALPDPRFDASLRAGVAHLAMSLVGSETRSADPVNTPIPWQRTAAFTIVALARTGQLSLARELSTLLAETDYYGGFGAEADAPGLAIWALTEVADAKPDTSFDRWLWPHVQRKAERILGLLDAKAEVRAPVAWAVVPYAYKRDDPTLVADASAGGLVVGRMDQGRPLLYVNATAYAGLDRAGALAARLGHRDPAERFHHRAQELREAWLAAFRPPESDNPRTTLSALWPMRVADTPAGREALRTELARRWNAEYDPAGGYRTPPPWTYFDVAAAHQWLLLGDGARAWQILEWFWEHQQFPGLYTWWEGRSEGNTFYWWDTARGWVRPYTVTPHYWTVAEMVLLQLDMLASLEPNGADTMLVIGRGVRPDWLYAPVGVRGLRIAGRTLDWSWHPGRVDVRVRGKPLLIRLGPGFPEHTVLHVAGGATVTPRRVAGALK